MFLNKFTPLMWNQFLIALILAINFGGQQIYAAATVNPENGKGQNSQSSDKECDNSKENDGDPDDCDGGGHHENDDDDTGKFWKIIGITVGIVFVAIILILIYICCHIKRKKSRSQMKTTARNNQNTVMSQTDELPSAPRPEVAVPFQEIVINTDSNRVISPSFNPGFITYDEKMIHDELPPPYDFSEISVHPTGQPRELETVGEEVQRNMQTT